MPFPVLSHAKRFALFLDVDGTLLDLAATPAEVCAPAGVIELLCRLVDRLDGALALLSGRAIADLDRIFDPLRLPIAGVHGGERRGIDGILHSPAVDHHFLEYARDRLGEFVRRHEGALLEDKGIAVAVHTRRVREVHADAAGIVALLAAESAGQFVLQQGKDVHELKPADVDKGAALAAFMAEPPFLGRIPLAVGDDVTDADAFAEAERRGGISVAVGYGAPAAMLRMEGPRALERWLRDWIA